MAATSATAATATKQQDTLEDKKIGGKYFALVYAEKTKLQRND